MSESSSSDEDYESWDERLQRIKENDPYAKSIMFSNDEDQEGSNSKLPSII